MFKRFVYNLMTVHLEILDQIPLAPFSKGGKLISPFYKGGIRGIIFINLRSSGWLIPAPIYCGL